MKKIINWTFGSVFRTFGRIIAYFLIGLLAFFLIQKNDLKITDLLGIYTVKADTLINWTTQQARIQTTHDGTDTWTNWTNINGTNSLTFEPTDPVKSIAYHLKTSQGMNKLYSYHFRFNYKPTPDSLRLESYYFENSTTGDRENVTCVQSMSSSNYYWFDCTFSPITSYTSNDYLYIKLNFYMSYLDEIKIGVRGFEELIGVNQVITEQTDNIIQNQNNNTQEIIDSLTEANENLLNGLTEQNQVCQYIDKTNIKTNNYYLASDGTLVANNSTGITDYINIEKATIKVVEEREERYCFYNINKELISCDKITNVEYLTIPNNSSYVRFTINKNYNKPTYQICKNGNQANVDATNELIHQINDSDTENALNGYKDFFNLFTNNGHGLTSIVSAPLNAINSLTNATCSPLVLPLPYMQNKNITLPCMRPIYEQHFGNFIILYDTITFGIISYWVILKLFKLIKNFKNPEDEGIEVVDL